MAQPPACAHAPNLRRAAALRPSRSGCVAARQRPRPQRHRHHRGNSIVDRILDVASTRGATLVPDAALTPRAVNLLTANEGTVAIAAADLSAADAQGSSETSVDTTPRRVSPKVTVAPFDPAVGAALAGAGNTPEVPTYLDPSLTVRLAHDSVTARRQDALGSIFWHALRHDTAPRTQILVPPATWNLQADDAQVMLTALSTSIRSGLAVPRPLPAVVAEATRLPKPAPSQRNGSGTPPPRAAASATTSPPRIAGQVGRLSGLTSALMTDDRTGLTGVQYTAPLREDMLRALSQSEPPDTRNGLAQQRLSRGRKDDQRLVRRRHDREPRWLVHPGHRAQPAAVGAAQRPGSSDSGAAACGRPAGDDTSPTSVRSNCRRAIFRCGFRSK